MGAKLKEITSEYRSFANNQVLTAKQLNDTVDYLTDHQRLTRVCLIGVGIVCGFKISRTNKAGGGVTISISQGSGITTDGDLLHLSDALSSGLRDIKIPKVHFDSYRIFEDKNAHYPHFINGDDKQIDLFELIPRKEESTYNNPIALQSEFLSDKFVVLYYENYTAAADVCTTVDCDNQGTPEVSRLRVFLLNNAGLNTIINRDSIFQKHQVLSSYSKLFPLAIPNVPLNPNPVSGNLNSLNALKSSYMQAITGMKASLLSAVNELFVGFSDVLELTNSFKTSLLTEISKLDNPEFSNHFQYRYNCAKDVCKTYNELYDLLLLLRSECCPDITAFPKHLILGKASNNGHLDANRHNFYPAPTNTSFESYLNQAKSLIIKMDLLLKRFSTSVLPSTLVTPSNASLKLSEQSVPAYYTHNDSFVNHWNFNKTIKNQQKFQFGYHRAHFSQLAWFINPFSQDTSALNHLRIEGPFGRNIDTILSELAVLKQQHFTDFDVLHYDLNTNFQQFKTFVAQHPSLAHSAGVTKGGTYIVLAQNNLVIADFCLDYKIQNIQEQASCCVLVECSYPWMSSLKYLNNLSRATKGTVKKLKPFAQHYKLQVTDYRINGHQLITSPVTLQIPIDEIFKRRMHAITEALNKRFNKGLVFDFNESQKRFLIIRNRDDVYSVSFKDITQTTTNPLYTYSSSGFFRNLKIFRADTMVCRELRKYNPDFYEKLHENMAPVNKDDDYGSYKTKWAEWNKSIQQLAEPEKLPLSIRPGIQALFNNNFPRFITKEAEFPDEIRNIINNAKSDVNATRGEGTLISIYVDGDWVNGSWVDNRMLNYFKQNRNNSHNPVVRLVELRRTLHHKTGVTKVSLYLNTNFESKYQNIIDKYKTHIDFYFGLPKGENAFKL